MNIFTEPSQGNTCLHLAVCSNSHEIIQHLIIFGADSNVTDFEGRTPYMRAAEFGHIQALTVLVEGVKNVDLSGMNEFLSRCYSVTLLYYLK